MLRHPPFDAPGNLGFPAFIFKGITESRLSLSEENRFGGQAPTSHTPGSKKINRSFGPQNTAAKNPKKLLLVAVGPTSDDQTSQPPQRPIDIIPVTPPKIMLQVKLSASRVPWSSYRSRPTQKTSPPQPLPARPPSSQAAPGFQAAGSW